MTTAINPAVIVSELKADDRPLLDRLISISVVVHTHSLSKVDESQMVAEVVVDYMITNGESMYCGTVGDALWEYFNQYSESEDWMYMGRDPEDGEKLYDLLNPGSTEQLTRKEMYRLMRDATAS